jgi:hypothetical protein
MEEPDENTVQSACCGIDAVRLHQQQQSFAAAEDDRGRPSKLGHDGRLPGWKQPALLS